VSLLGVSVRVLFSESCCPECVRQELLGDEGLHNKALSEVACQVHMCTIDISLKANF